MASRKIEDLHSAIREKAIALLGQSKGHGIDLIITCTWRGPEEQERLYASGRTEPGPVRTWARAGQSKHNFVVDGKPASLAFDVVPVRDGKAVWETTGEDGKNWQTIGEIGISLGLEWAGRWPRKKREYPHFQISLA